MAVSLAIWTVVGIITGVGVALAFKQDRAQMVGNAIICVVCAIVGGWLLGFFGLAVGGPYVGAAFNAIIGTAVAPIVIVVVNFISDAA